MNRRAVVLFLLTVLFFVNQIQISMASQEIYLWKLFDEVTHVTAEYQIVITASDAWEADMPYEVNVRLTTKNYYGVRIDSAKVILNSENFSLESLSQEEPAVLTYAGAYWEEKFAFDIPSEKLVSGENFTVSVVAVISISAVPESGYGFVGTWDNYGNPVTVNLYFLSQATTPTPSPSPEPTPEAEPFPTTLVIASIGSAAIVGLGLLVYFKKRNHARINKHSEIEQSST
jgi:hypothetical protein